MVSKTRTIVLLLACAAVGLLGFGTVAMADDTLTYAPYEAQLLVDSNGWISSINDVPTGLFFVSSKPIIKAVRVHLFVQGPKATLLLNIREDRLELEPENFLVLVSKDVGGGGKRWYEIELPEPLAVIPGEKYYLELVVVDYDDDREGNKVTWYGRRAENPVEGAYESYIYLPQWKKWQTVSGFFAFEIIHE